MLRPFLIIGVFCSSLISGFLGWAQDSELDQMATTETYLSENSDAYLPHISHESIFAETNPPIEDQESQEQTR
jgi:hypothetical protein